jgi:hypothetical protein
MENVSGIKRTDREEEPESPRPVPPQPLPNPLSIVAGINLPPFEPPAPDETSTPGETIDRNVRLLVEEWKPKSLRDFMSIGQRDLAERVFGAYAIEQWRVAGYTTREIWEITGAAEACKKFADQFFKDEHGNDQRRARTCWLCGKDIDVILGLTPECEHVMPVAQAVLFKNMYNTCNYRIQSPDMQDYYKAEYLWSHEYCNQVKSDTNFFTVVEKDGRETLAPNISTIVRYLKELQTNKTREGGNELRERWGDGNEWMKNRIDHIDSVCKTLISTLGIGDGASYLKTCIANAKKIPHIESGSSAQPEIMKLLFGKPPILATELATVDHGKSPDQAFYMQILFAYKKLYHALIRPPTVDQSEKPYTQTPGAIGFAPNAGPPSVGPVLGEYATQDTSRAQRNPAYLEPAKRLLGIMGDNDVVETATLEQILRSFDHLKEPFKANFNTKNVPKAWATVQYEVYKFFYDKVGEDAPGRGIKLTINELKKPLEQAGIRLEGARRRTYRKSHQSMRMSSKRHSFSGKPARR